MIYKYSRDLAARVHQEQYTFTTKHTTLLYRCRDLTYSCRCQRPSTPSFRSSAHDRTRDSFLGGEALDLTDQLGDLPKVLSANYIVVMGLMDGSPARLCMPCTRVNIKMPRAITRDVHTHIHVSSTGSLLSIILLPRPQLAH